MKYRFIEKSPYVLGLATVCTPLCTCTRHLGKCYTTYFELFKVRLHLGVTLRTTVSHTGVIQRAISDFKYIKDYTQSITVVSVNRTRCLVNQAT